MEDHHGEVQQQQHHHQDHQEEEEDNFQPHHHDKVPEHVHGHVVTSHAPEHVHNHVHEHEDYASDADEPPGGVTAPQQERSRHHVTSSHVTSAAHVPAAVIGHVMLFTLLTLQIH